MLIGERIKKAIEKSGWDPNKVAAAINMSTANLYRIFKRDSVETKYLQKLSDLLGVPLSYFMDENSDYNIEDMKPLPHSFTLVTDKAVAYHRADIQNELDKANIRIEALEMRLRDKEEMIYLLRTQVATLLGQPVPPPPVYKSTAPVAVEETAEQE